MRSRVIALLVPALLVAGLVLPTTAAVAADDDVLLLATEGEAEVPAEGPTMMGPNDTENPAAPEEYEPNFLWGASVGLLVLMLLMVVGLGGLYLVLVYLPNQRRESEQR